MEELRCIGCGSVIQSEDPSRPGYVPQSKLAEPDETLVCRRCFRLRHYNEVTPIAVSQDDFYRAVGSIANEDALVVKLIDIFDLEGSMIPQISTLTNHKDLVILANKRDLLPKVVNDAKLIHHIRKIVSDYNLKPQQIHLMSAIKYQNIDHVMDAILELANNRNIYVVGATNVGKSTFINTLLRAYGGSKDDVITVSRNAGTTLDLIEIPIGEQSIFDTPGIINETQLTHYLSPTTLRLVNPLKEIKAKIYQLSAGQTLFVGGLARVDFVSGDDTSFVCYFGEKLTIHRTKLANADHLFDTQVGGVLSPPSADEKFPLVAHSLRIGKGKHDIVIPGLGFIAVSGPVQVVVHVHDKVRPYVREALI